MLVEIKVAKEPVLAPGLLRMRVPLLVGVNSLFIPLCNFGVMCESVAVAEAGGAKQLRRLLSDVV